MMQRLCPGLSRRHGMPGAAAVHRRIDTELAEPVGHAMPAAAFVTKKTDQRVQRVAGMGRLQSGRGGHGDHLGVMFMTPL